MRIAIIGTRGIPNHYGGFEQYAELLSVFLVKKGWRVTVYNSSEHPYREDNFKGVRIKRMYDPEHRVGTVGQFIYDYNCIIDARKEAYDIIYQLGYTSSAIFNFLLPRRPVIVTNMDGMEWQRKKYGKFIRSFLKYAERLVVRKSDYLVADAVPIQEYLDRTYGVKSFYSAYTAVIPEQYNINLLDAYALREKRYALLIARMEPENNIEMIAQGFIMSMADYPLVIVGSTHTPFGKYMERIFASEKIRFIGPVYNKQAIDTLRYYAACYFHGHSVGGTNPSLLEAMACGSVIVAHDNIFNRSVLEDGAVYFKNKEDIRSLLNAGVGSYMDTEKSREANRDKIKNRYSEQKVFGELEGKFRQWLYGK